MSFYTYHQNNSGGHHVYDPNAGISVEVIVEADSAAEADRRARAIGIYFNGCDAGIDCSCCGDRWYSQWHDDGDLIPSTYGEPIEGREFDRKKWHKWVDGYEGFVHYANGKVAGFWHGKSGRDR